MFRFAHPDCLYLLLLVPLFFVAFIWLRVQQKKRLGTLIYKDLQPLVVVGVSSARRWSKFLLLMLALVLLVLVLARPQYGVSNELVKKQGIEAVVALDVSNSMLCEDVAPNRLERSKMLLGKLTETLEEDKVALLAFAGTAVTLMPMSADAVSAKMFIDQMNTTTVSVQGTDLGAAINRAMASFSNNQAVGKALILITDAEDNEATAEAAVKEAAERGIQLFVLSVGTEQGGPIPMGDGTFKKDRSGNVVVTKLNASVGKRLAKAGKGAYMNISQDGDIALKQLSSELRKLQQTDFTASNYAEYDEQFAAVALLLFVVLLIDMCLIERKNRFRWRWLSWLRPMSETDTAEK
jgi:Ca-activated chloride channel family protein